MKPEVARVIANAQIIPRLAPSRGLDDGDPIPSENCEGNNSRIWDN